MTKMKPFWRLNLHIEAQWRDISWYSLIHIGSRIELVPKCYRHQWLVTIKTWWGTPYRNLDEYGSWKRCPSVTDTNGLSPLRHGGARLIGIWMNMGLEKPSSLFFSWIKFCPGLNMLNWNLANLAIFTQRFCNNSVTTFTFPQSTITWMSNNMALSRSCLGVSCESDQMYPNINLLALEPKSSYIGVVLDQLGLVIARSIKTRYYLQRTILN